MTAVVSIASLVLSVTRWDEADSVAHKLTSSLWQSGIVVIVVTLIIEPYSRRRYLEESASDLIWAFANPGVPPEYKAAISGRISERIIVRKASWQVVLKWTDPSRSVLCVQLSVHIFGTNYDIRPREVFKPTFLVSSIDGYDSAFVDWHFQIDADGVSQRLGEAALVGHVEQREDGSYQLNENELWPDPIAPGASFSRSKTSRLFRHATGDVPLMHVFPILAASIVIDSADAPGVSVSVLHRGKSIRHESQGGQRELTFDNVVLPGEAFLITWRPTEEVPE